MNAQRSADRQTCSSLARAIGEPLYGSAPYAESWILLEQPGPWGADALGESDLDPGVAEELQRRTSPLSCRILLIRRRAGRYGSSALTCYLVNCAPGSAWMEEVSLDKPADLLDLELESLLFPEPPQIGRPSSEVYLVCTHARRDPCCAEHGRALLGPLEAAGAPVWESSHQGGHRFAANLACFPYGLFYGRVRPEDTNAIVASYRRGDLHLANLRGRSGYNPIVQAADHFARSQTGITSIDAWKVERVGSRNESAWVTFREESHRHQVELRLDFWEPRPESCNKPKLTKPEIWSLVSFSTSPL